MTPSFDDAVTIAYLDLAFDRMLDVARRAGRGLNERPGGPSTNSVAALVVHCSEVAEFWLGHAGLGRPTSRERDAEFSRTATLTDLEQLVESRRAQVARDVGALAAGHGQDSELRQFLVGGTSDDALVLHVVEELFQHVGHMEVTVDALAARDRVLGPVFHLALAGEWAEAVERGGPYERSTIGRSYQEVGFIHCSFAHQLAATASRFYAGRNDVVVLELSPALAGSIRVEQTDGAPEPFPHLHAPLDTERVVAVRPLRWPATRRDTERPG